MDTPPTVSGTIKGNDAFCMIFALLVEIKYASSAWVVVLMDEFRDHLCSILAVRNGGIILVLLRNSSTKRISFPFLLDEQEFI